MMATDTKTVDVSVWSESKVPAKGSRDTILHRSSLQIQVLSISSGAMGVCDVHFHLCHRSGSGVFVESCFCGDLFLCAFPWLEYPIREVMVK